MNLTQEKAKELITEKQRIDKLYNECFVKKEIIKTIRKVLLELEDNTDDFSDCNINNSELLWYVGYEDFINIANLIKKAKEIEKMRVLLRKEKDKYGYCNNCLEYFAENNIHKEKCYSNCKNYNK